MNIARGVPPEDLAQRIPGLKEAIENTKRRIAEYGANRADASTYELHLKNLEHQLEKAAR